MPVINIDPDELIALSGIPDIDEALDLISTIGAGDLERGADGGLEIEFFPNRPDLYSVEGLARALRTYRTEALTEYDVTRGEIVLTVDSSVDDVRPFISGGVVRGVKVSEELILSMMNLQEKLHLTVGRGRAKVAIGLHDLAKVTPPFIYKAVEPGSISFVPLGGSRPLDLGEILTEHEKGQDYAHLMEGHSHYPIILDANDDVLSFPPVINGTLTTVTTETRDIFIDCTGTDLETVQGVVRNIATALAERGGTIESIDVVHGQGFTAPDLARRRTRVDMDYVRRTIGLDGDGASEQVLTALARTDMQASVEDGEIVVDHPAYRMDIMHPVDLVEEVAIGIGYRNLSGLLPGSVTFGSIRPETEAEETFRGIMTGLGFLEVKSLLLTDPRAESERMNRSGEERDLWWDSPSVLVANPKTSEHSVLRTTLIPSLFGMIHLNKHHPLPQKVFEVGHALPTSEKELRGALLWTDAKAGFSGVKGIAELLWTEVHPGATIEEADEPTFIGGRAAYIVVDGERVGIFGEVHPSVLSSWELTHPVVCLEMRL